MNYHVPPPHVLDALERGDSGALRAMRDKAVRTREENARKRKAEEARQAEMDQMWVQFRKNDEHYIEDPESETEA